jgi:probable rRNA maturation factor
VTLLVEIENHSGWRIDEPAAATVMRAALSAEGLADGEVGVIFVDEPRIAELNLAHRGKGVATDVLSFPLDGLDALPDGLPRQLGDVVVCPSVAAAEGTPIETLLVHGALHLAGYDHDADTGEMLARQELLLQEVDPVDAEPA